MLIRFPLPPRRSREKGKMFAELGLTKKGLEEIHDCLYAIVEPIIDDYLDKGLNKKLYENHSS